MSTDLEARLAHALHTDAAAAPPAGDLLGRVHVRARQRARRRHFATAAVMAVGLAGAGLAATALPRDDVLAPPTQYAAPTGQGPLVSGRLPALEFPLTPGWLPEGVASAPRVTKDESGLHAAYDDATRPGMVGVTIWIGPRDMAFSGDGVRRRATTVKERPAVLAELADSTALVWEPTPGTFITVLSGNRWGTEPIVRRVAESLREEAFLVRPPLDLELLPRDAELAEWSTDGRLTFLPADEAAAATEGASTPGVVRIAARRATADLTGRGEQVTVSGRTGWLLRQTSGRSTLVLQLPDDVCLVLDVPAWDRADVLRFAESTRYLGGIPPQEG